MLPNCRRSARRTFLALAVFCASAAVARAEEAPSAETNDAQPMPTPGGKAGRRFSSEKNADENAGGTKFGSPHGPAMDGVRGSAIGPAPGAFGTDAGSPSDLRH